MRCCTFQNHGEEVACFVQVLDDVPLAGYKYFKNNTSQVFVSGRLDHIPDALCKGYRKFIKLIGYWVEARYVNEDTVSDCIGSGVTTDYFKIRKHGLFPFWAGCPALVVWVYASA